MDIKYNQYKDADPDDTIKKIKSILKTLEIDHQIVEEYNSITNCYSLRVELKDTEMGTNGKGITKSLAYASAYGELMERLQNQIGYSGKVDGNIKDLMGFDFSPDEKYLSISEIIASNDKWLDLLQCNKPFDKLLDDDSNLFIKQGLALFPELNESYTKEEILKQLNLKKDNLDKLLCIPFYNVNKNCLTYIPLSLVRILCSSNGMCAGNTVEEAIIHGISEIIERYANIKILKENISPPSIPHEALEKYKEVYETIRDLEQQGFDVIVKDFTLGGFYPVYGAIIINKTTNTYSVRLGAHSDPQIALERAFTESFQGRNLSNNLPCQLSLDKGVTSDQLNINNIIRVGGGYYPNSLFLKTPSYQFKSIKKINGSNNKEILHNIIELLKNNGYEILVRDVSFMGFPSYQVIIPGITEIEKIDSLLLNKVELFNNITNTVNNINESSKEEVEDLVLYLELVKHAVIENTLPKIFKIPLKNNFSKISSDISFLIVLIYLKIENYDKALIELENYIRRIDSNPYLNCLYYYIEGKKSNCSKEEIDTILRSFFEEYIVDKLINDLNMFKNDFYYYYENPKEATNSNCSYSSYNETMTVIKKIKKVYFENQIVQTKLEEVFI